MEIELRDVTCGYEKRRVLESINLKFMGGNLYCILGSNGIGKTTLFKTLLGFIPPLAGEIIINKKNTNEVSSKELATYLSYVPQAKNYSYQYTVQDTVMMGRSIFIKQFDSPSSNDVIVVSETLKRLGIYDLRNEMYASLSGGQQQIVLVARALVQQAKFIIMDEPASNLDFENQKLLLDILKILAQQGIGVIMSSHSPDHALYCNAQIVLVNRARKILFGSAEDLLTQDNLRETYGVGISILSGKSQDDRLLRACCLY